MTSYELAIDQDGEPFVVSPDVVGWRVRKAADGRGRPELMYKNGKPLIVRVNASHSDLLAAAGPGKYRLDAVDALGHVVTDVPVACTGPLREVDEVGPELSSNGEPMHGMYAARQIASYEDVICQVVSANTRMVEKAIGQLGTVMSGVAEVLNAAHNAGITSRVPPTPPPPPAPIVIETDEVPSEADASTAGMSDIIQLIIRETIAKAVPLIFEKIAGVGGSGVGGLPLAALFDWRKAAPTPPAAPSAPVASAPAEAAAHPAPAGAPSSAAGAGSPHSVTTPSSPTAPASAGAAPNRESPLGAAPAGMATPPAASSPATEEDAAAMLNAHVLQVWQGLTPQEQARAGQLIARLTDKERAAWIAELATLTVPEAIARARAIVRAQRPPTPAHTPQLPTTTPSGDNQ